VSIEEGIEFIKNDCSIGDVLQTAMGGFVTKANLPFRPPKYYKNNIIIWPPVDIHPGAKIDYDVTIGRYTNIMGNVSIGEGSRIQGFCFIPDCVTIGKYVFIGPNVTFCNVKNPKVRIGDAMKHRDGQVVVEDFASIGAGVVICPNVRIGSKSLIGAGAVVTKDVKAGTVVCKNPARLL